LARRRVPVAAEEIKEVIEGTLGGRSLLSSTILPASSAARKRGSLYRGFRVDSDHCGFKLGRNLRKRIRQRHWVRNDQRRRFLLARRFHPTRNDRSNDDPNTESRQNQGEKKHSLVVHGLPFWIETDIIPPHFRGGTGRFKTECSTVMP